MTALAAMTWMAGVCVAGQRVAKEAGSTGTYRISGVVVDAMTGAAVPGAELWTLDEVGLRTVADEEGRFALEGLEEGKYPLNATAPGYVKEGPNQHGAFFTGIAVGPELDSEHIVFKLHREAIIYGRVTDERGDAVRRATVILFSENVEYGKHAVTVRTQMLTNDLGAYRFTHLTPGKYYVGVMATPWWAATGMKFVDQTRAVPKSDPAFDVVYPLTYFAGATEDSGAEQLVTKSGDSIEANVRLAAVPSVHVLMTNMEGYQWRGQNPTVTAIQKPFGAASLPVNSVSSAQVKRGVYEVSGLPPGEVRLTVARAGETEWDSHGIRVNAVDGESVDAAAKAAVSSVSGMVVTAEGSKQPIQGDVVLRSGEDDAVSARVEKDGTFRIPAVEEGTYALSVNTRTSGDYVTKVTGSGAKVNGRTMKIEGAQEVRLTVTLGRRLGQVGGVVKMDGRPRAGVMVLMVPESTDLPGEEMEQLTRMDQSDSDGTFTLRGVVPGKYVLMAIEDGWELEWRQEGVLAGYREEGVRVELSAGEERKVAVEGMKKVAGDSRRLGVSSR